MYRTHPNRSKAAIQRARQARKNPSVAEEIVWQFLRNSRMGFKFRREFPILRYRVDFFCAEARLAVEFDGEQHDPGRDALRDQALAELDIEVLRIPNRTFFMLDRDLSLDPFSMILARCEERSGRKGIAFWD